MFRYPVTTSTQSGVCFHLGQGDMVTIATVVVVNSKDSTLSGNFLTPEKGSRKWREGGGTHTGLKVRIRWKVSTLQASALSCGQPGPALSLSMEPMTAKGKGALRAGNRSHHGQMLPPWQDSYVSGRPLLFLCAWMCSRFRVISLSMGTCGCRVLAWRRPVRPQCLGL